MARTAIVASVAAVVAAGIATAAVLLFTSSPTAAPEPATTSPATFTLRGSLTVANNLKGSISYKGTNCEGGSGYSDLTPGTAVTVGNSTGQVVATGAIGSTYTATTVVSGVAGLPAAPMVTSCVLSFTVQGVPEGLPSYVVTVSHRGARVVQASEAHDRVDLSIG